MEGTTVPSFSAELITAGACVLRAFLHLKILLQQASSPPPSTTSRPLRGMPSRAPQIKADFEAAAGMSM